MARFHLVGDRRCNIAKIELAGFFRNASMEHDLEQQIAKLVAQ